ncbi:glycoside hydrolase family 15 protein [Thiohalomonas denitrificans]|uniref:glycoside hydrolase family 15 protein n=1 Tax=Thiohalomonas denitrificans TaxID=415747 RepID=UPI0026EBBE27|nr:glycoside hydrolase family 15 protein [Thiohalomonas denitrificans]
METGNTAIGDYAIIGDCRSAALISRSGSIDWLCRPRFDSPSLFGALLDPEKGGRFAVRPTAHFTTRRRYVGDTNVLETTFYTDNGVLRLTDLMPVDSEENKRRQLWAAHQILRRVECVEGEVEVEVICDPRPNYGREQCRPRDRGRLGIYYEHQGRALILRSEMPITISSRNGAAYLQHTLRAGECRHLSTVYTVSEPSFIPPLGEEAERRIRASLDWWTAWSNRCTYTGPHASMVRRSALVLKLMTFAPSGAVVAAPTTSLPEWPGGVRNWDYRYCWLRDASLTLRALYELGYGEEGNAFIDWLMHSTRLTRPELQIIYNVYGETGLDESELDHLAGFAGSRPVRIGNDASHQFQLDIYGEVIDAVYEFVRHGGHLDAPEQKLLVGFGKTACRRWREPDEGIWEVRGGRKHHTYSKAMCWVALDRLLRLHHEGHLKRAPVELFRAERDALRAEIEQRGYSAEVDSYVSTLDGEDLDASLLLLSRHGYLDPRSERAGRTREAIREKLGRNGLLYRYRAQDDGLPGEEAAFGICSFWAVADLALAGEIRQAEGLFECIIGYANDVGLFAEEINPDSGAALGNFPQAFTHVGLVDAALLIEDAKRGGKTPKGGAR